LRLGVIAQTRLEPKLKLELAITVANSDEPITVAGLREQRDEILGVASRHGASNVRVFGSVAREEPRSGSDVDFLVDMQAGRSLLDLGGLLMDLSDLLARDVDVVTETSLRPRVRSRVLAEAQPL
jgi:predicted nucleotidyltransferase